MPVVFYQPQGILGRLRTLTHSTTKKNFSQTLILATDPWSVFFVLAKREALKQKTRAERFAPGEKTFRFEPFGVQNARNRSRIAFVHSYATR
ncbi:hypothetical protein [Escherichia coli]|uniref:hypothetical protein n=1 Tax=Escherichia coli TaxID=562 RepID=UPI00163C4B39|nr:hypothetical protein [Escherichia coli]